MRTDVVRDNALDGSWAYFSECRRYRYALGRTTGVDSRARCAWIMLNPSKASATDNDPTVSRVIRFSRLWGFGIAHVVNLWPVIATDPKVMMAMAPEERDPEQHGFEYISSAVAFATRIVVAWGANKDARERGEQIYNTALHRRRDDVVCLGTSGDGSPKHPLARGKAFIPYDMEPQPWRPA